MFYKSILKRETTITVGEGKFKFVLKWNGRLTSAPIVIRICNRLIKF